MTVLKKGRRNWLFYENKANKCVCTRTILRDIIIMFYHVLKFQSSVEYFKGVEIEIEHSS